jgi:hypothetical protein
VQLSGWNQGVEWHGSVASDGIRVERETFALDHMQCNQAREFAVLLWLCGRVNKLLVAEIRK